MSNMNNKKGASKVKMILIIALAILVVCGFLFLRMKWKKFKASASFGLYMTIFIIIVILIAFFIIRSKIKTAGEVRAAKKEEKLKAQEKIEVLEDKIEDLEEDK